MSSFPQQAHPITTVTVSSTPGPQTNKQRLEHLTDRMVCHTQDISLLLSVSFCQLPSIVDHSTTFDICPSRATPRYLSLWHTFPHWHAAIRSDPVCPCSGLPTACDISGLARLAARPVLPPRWSEPQSPTKHTPVTVRMHIRLAA